MSAQEIIEKIRAEVERRKTIQLKRIQDGDMVDAAPYDKNEAYNEILSILSDLEKEEKPIEGLEEEITEFISNNYEVDYYEGLKHLGEYLHTYDVEEIARHFAQWQKEQMMKEAVEGYVDKDFIVTEGPFYFIRSVNLDLPNGFKEGDKVKLIIVKED